MVYTLLPRLPPFFLQPPCGNGVTSSMIPILRPRLESALTAACAPGPGFVGPLCPPGALIFTWMQFIPLSIAISAAFFAAAIAVVGLLSNLSDLTICPPDASAMVSDPVMSVICMIILLYDAKT